MTVQQKPGLAQSFAILQIVLGPTRGFPLDHNFHNFDVPFREDRQVVPESRWGMSMTQMSDVQI